MLWFSAFKKCIISNEFDYGAYIGIMLKVEGDLFIAIWNLVVLHELLMDFDGVLSPNYVVMCF